MNYSLTISLDGADKAESALDSLLDKMGKLGAGKMPSIMDWARVGSEASDEGEKAGEDFAKKFAVSFSEIKLGLAQSLTELGDTVKFDAMTESAKKLKELVTESNGISEVTANNALRTAATWERAAAVAKKRIEDEKKAAQPTDPTKRQYAMAALATAFNPFIGARAFSDLQKKSGKEGGIAGAIFGAGGAGGYIENFAIIKVLLTSFHALVKAINLTLEAYENARKAYSKSLQSGLGIGFTVKRGMLADLLGVGEEEVIKYGAAINYLNQRIAFASSELAKNTMPLTGVGFELKIVGQNIKALWSEIAAGLAPAMQTLISEFNDFLTVLGGTHVLKGIGMVLGIILQMFANITGAIEIIFNTILVGIKTIAAGFALLIVGIINLLAKIPGAGKLGIHAMDGSKITDDLKKSYDDLGNEITNYGKNFLGGKNNVPEPQAYMKQLPASAWEKLGLVIGGGGNSTNDLIRKSNSYLKAIADTVSKTGSGRGAGFGMSPVTANP